MIREDGEPEQDDPGSLSESENLAEDSLSGYDCDSEGEGGWNDTDAEDEDGEMEIYELGLKNLKFQLDAAEAGGFCGFYLTGYEINHAVKPGKVSMRLT